MTLTDYLDTIENSEHRKIFSSLIEWVQQEFPNLVLEFKWNQPMFIDHGTFIIAFSKAKNHFTVAPEKIIIDRYRSDIEKTYIAKKMLFQIKWKQEIDFQLLRLLINASIEEKKDYMKFWLE